MRNVPRIVDRALREKARREGKSLNEVVVEALMRALGVEEEVRHRDLRDIAGTWAADDAIDRALEEQRRIDPDLWR